MTFNDDASTLLHTNAGQDNVSDFSQGLHFKQGKLEDEVILNVSPHKFEKPKDDLFLKFFSLYTKRSVEEKKESRQLLNKHLPTESTPRSRF